MSKILCFNQIHFDQSCIFDSLSLSIRFHNSTLPICTLKSHRFLYSNQSMDYTAPVGVSMRVPDNCTRCDIIAHLHIINMRTCPSVLQLDLSSQSSSCSSLDEEVMEINTELGCLRVGVGIREENYLYREGSLSSISTLQRDLQGIQNGKEELQRQQSVKRWLDRTKKKQDNNISHSSSENNLLSMEKTNKKP